jgi:HAD superfamily hydrolase (TIGR01450 family)
VRGAPEALAQARRQGTRLAFVTNNAARPPEVVARHLSELGIEAEPADVVTSAQAAATMLASELPAGARVLAVGGEGLRQALTAKGLTPVASADDGPVAVAQGFAPETSWTMLLEACVAVHAGLPWIATNTDLTIPTPRGTAPGNGALVEVVRTATGGTPRVAGKPFRPLMDESCVRTNAQRALVVGDRLDTDIAGAHAAGLPSLLVLTGVSGAPELLRAEPELRPTYLAADLFGLHRPHAAPRRDGDAWVGQFFRAFWDSVRSPEPGSARLVVDRLPGLRTSGQAASVGGPGAGAGGSGAGGPGAGGSGADGSGAAASRRGGPGFGVPGRTAVSARISSAESQPGDPEAVDALRVVCAAVWDRADASAGGVPRSELVDAAELALRPWTTGMVVAR